MTGPADKSRSDVTRLLQAVGDSQPPPENVDQLLAAVYPDLRALAAEYLRQERPDHTLQPTALVHEAYLRLVDQTQVHWQSRGHFIAVAAQAIRRILVDHARGKNRKKRGEGNRTIRLSSATPIAPGRDIDLLALDEALQRLSEEEPMDARIVEMRFFGGLTVEEIAAVLKVTDRTVRRHWNFAKAWLSREILKGGTRPLNNEPT